MTFNKLCLKTIFLAGVCVGLVLSGFADVWAFGLSAQSEPAGGNAGAAALSASEGIRASTPLMDHIRANGFIYFLLCLFVLSCAGIVVLLKNLSLLLVPVGRDAMLRRLKDCMPFNRKVSSAIVVFSNIGVSFSRKIYHVNLFLDAHFIYDQDKTAYSKVVIATKLEYDDESRRFYLSSPQIKQMDNRILGDKNKHDILLACKMLLKNCHVYELQSDFLTRRARRLYLKSVSSRKDTLITKLDYAGEKPA